MIPNTIHFCFFENEFLNYLKASPTLIIVIILKIILSTKVTENGEKGVTKFYLHDSHQKRKKKKKKFCLYIHMCNLVVFVQMQFFIFIYRLKYKICPLNFTIIYF